MSTAYRFLAAIAVSLLLHILALSGVWLHIPAPGPASRPFEARLLSPPATAAVTQPATPPLPAKRSAHRRTTPLAPVVAAAAPPAFLPQPEPVATDADVDAPDSAAPAKTQVEAPVATKTPAPAAASAVAPARSLPSKGRITYTLYLGTDKFSVGKAVQSWEVEGDDYKLGSMAETTGIADLFRSQRLNYLSAGKITAHGLRPQTFLMSRTRRGSTEAARAEFDWNAAKIMLGKAPDQHALALPANSQDFISFMYQFSLTPPAPGRIRVSITNGSRLESYELDVLEPENIETPLGTLTALPIKQVRRTGDESIEVWLAVDYRYLPVKVRFIDREGNPSGEQVVSEIQIDEK
ncbi:MAG: DUF3108 domain-containing protein [Pseudomonadota bacterium]